MCPCVRRTWVVPSTHRRRVTEVQARTPPYGRVAGGTANARWRYREGTEPVRWTCLRCGIFCMRFRASEARRPQETCVAGTVAAESPSDPNQPQETQHLRRNSAAAPDTKSRSTYGGLWPRHNVLITSTDCVNPINDRKLYVIKS